MVDGLVYNEGRSSGSGAQLGKHKRQVAISVPNDSEIAISKRKDNSLEVLGYYYPDTTVIPTQPSLVS